MQIIADIDDDLYIRLFDNGGSNVMDMRRACVAIRKGTPVTADTLADMVMNERIYGDFKQDICYEEPVIEDVKCRLELSIIDRRPCYCGAELRETWRDK